MSLALFALPKCSLATCSLAHCLRRLDLALLVCELASSLASCFFLLARWFARLLACLPALPCPALPLPCPALPLPCLPAFLT